MSISVGSTPTVAKQVLKPLILVAVLVAVGIVAKILAAHLHDPLVQTYFADQGVLGYVVFFLAGACLTAIGVPRQAVAFVGGYAIGLEGGFLLSLAAQTTGCATDFFGARFLVRGWTQRRLGHRLRGLDEKFSASPFMTSLILRLLPVGNNTVLNLLAGVSSIRPLPFIGASTIGYVPQTIIFVMLGSGVEVSHDKQITVAGILFLLSAILGAILLKRNRSN